MSTPLTPYLSLLLNGVYRVTRPRSVRVWVRGNLDTEEVDYGARVGVNNEVSDLEYYVQS